VLAQDGYAVTVLEQAEQFGEIGAGIQLGPNIFKMFEHLGLTAAIDAVAYYPPAVRMHDVRTGELVVNMPMRDAQGASTSQATYGYPYGVIYRADLHDVFLHACQAQPKVTLRTGAKVKDYTQDAQGVQVTLDSGETLAGAVLLGADGIWSNIRSKIVGDGKPRVSGHIAYRAVLKRKDVPPELWDDNVTR
jgi:3-hydroxybenzoate 6-monooxygenase